MSDADSKTTLPTGPPANNQEYVGTPIGNQDTESRRNDADVDSRSIQPSLHAEPVSGISHTLGDGDKGGTDEYHIKADGGGSNGIVNRETNQVDTDRKHEPRENSKHFEDPVTYGWAQLLKYSKEFDDKMLKDWQDELANLLTFTGLFSAVVTGFVVASLLMLQEDTGQRTVDLLGQISQQLSSFNVASAMINSTLQPSFATSRFIPSHAAVSINVLWISSLTLSLMAAFWTIAVQQWLRHIPLPRELGVRESIRLRQLRRGGVLTWQVPVIVSLLPLVVQISVLLFLFGLRRLLQELDHFVATVFTAIGAALFLVLLVSVILPLIFPECPYKSPLLPTIWALTRKTIFPAVYVLLYIALRLSAILFVFSSILLFQIPLQATETKVDFSRYSLLYYSRASVWTTYLRRILTLDASPLVFWRLLERWYMRNKERYNDDTLDRSALSFVPVVVPKSKRESVLPCLQSLCREVDAGTEDPPEDARMKAATDWVCHDLGIWPSELEGRYPDIFRPGHIEKFNRLALIRLRPVLLNALPSAWTASGPNSKFSSQMLLGSELGILTLLFWSSVEQIKTDVYASSHTIPILLRIQTIQFKQMASVKDMVKKEQASLWLPVTLLFRYYQESETASPNYQEADAVSKLIISALESECSTASHVDRLSTALPGALAAIATTLHAGSLRLPHTNPDDAPRGATPPPPPLQVSRIIEALSNFSNFLSTSSEIICNALFMCHILHSMKLDGRDLYLVHTPALNSIANTLKKFASSEFKLLHSPSHQVAKQLLKVCYPVGAFGEATTTLKGLATLPIVELEHQLRTIESLPAVAVSSGDGSESAELLGEK